MACHLSGMVHKWLLPSPSFTRRALYLGLHSVSWVFHDCTCSLRAEGKRNGVVIHDVVTIAHLVGCWGSVGGGGELAVSAKEDRWLLICLRWCNTGLSSSPASSSARTSSGPSCNTNSLLFKDIFICVCTLTTAVCFC